MVSRPTMIRREGLDAPVRIQEIGHYLAALILFGYVCSRVWTSASGDASIYFVFFRQFFDLPFSFQQGVVSHGASSPLHVVIFACVHALFGSYWLAAAKVLNFALIFISLILLQRSLKVPVWLMTVWTALVCSFGVLMASASELFEVGLVFLAISLLFVFLKSEKHYPALITAGTLHLVRPELILITFVVYGIYLARYRDGNHFKVMIAMGLLNFGFYAYMAWNGAGWLPSSVVGRAVRALEDPWPWSVKFQQIITYLGVRFDNPYWMVLIGFAAYCFHQWRGSRRWPVFETAIVLPIVALYALVPPGVYIQRYLIPILPVTTWVVMVWIQQGLEWLGRWNVANDRASLAAGAKAWSLGIAGLALAVGWIALAAPWQNGFYRVTQQEILLPDLGRVINQIADPEDKVVVYEIQSQYYMNARAVSITVIGNQAMDFLLKRETFEDFVERQGIRYVVTMNSFNYRKVYDDTLLEHLYAHDLENPVGAVLTAGHFTFTKVATNPDFADPSRYVVKTLETMNHDNQLRVYNDKTHRAGTHFTWNSIYRVDRVLPAV